MVRHHTRRVTSKVYKDGISELAAKIFSEPSPKLEPYTFLLTENHRMIPYHKNRFYSPWYAQPPIYNFKLLIRNLDNKNLFVDEHWRFKYQGWRTKYIRGKQPAKLRWVFDLTEEEKALFEANKEKK